MKKLYMSFIVMALFGMTEGYSQLGPNLLGAKGSFSAPFVTANPNAAACTHDGNNSYSPLGNIGNKLESLSSSEPGTPKSGYTYVSGSTGLQPEYTYTLIKNIGDGNGGNCIKGDWKGKDHTGDGGWFMAVNGAPSDNPNYSRIFYRIEDITVCPGTEYQFGAWVINVLPKSSGSAQPGSEPDISFVVTSSEGSDTIARSGKIAYQDIPDWVEVTGTYTVPEGVTTVTLEVVNSTTVAQGNDLGLDDISFRVLESSIDLSGDLEVMCAESTAHVIFTVNDETETNKWYKWQISTDGGANFTDFGEAGVQMATFEDGSYSLTLTIPDLDESMNGTVYRLVASTSPDAFEASSCSKYVQDFVVRVQACGPTPVDLMNFNGRYSNGEVILDWQTAQEVNSDKFEVYRSTDAQNYTLIGSVKSAGYSGTVISYSYTDNQAGSNQYIYYKLKQIDLDGKFIYTNVIRVSVGGLQASLQAFPNPFTTRFTISFGATKNADATLILRNSIGQPVMQQTIKVVKGNNSMDISNLPRLAPGVYYATIHNDDIHYNIKLQKQ